MVAGLLRPDAGSISIDGIDALADPVAAKQITAWLSDEPMIYDKLTPFEYLEFVAGLWRIDAAAAEARARELIGWLGLEPHAHERCEGFSQGMRQKVALAGALVHDPKLIILDEPLTGLDAGSARLVKNVLRERVAAGGTVIMTTHILEVAERMADRIGVIASGRLIAEGTLDELRRKTGKTATSLEDTFLTLVAEPARNRSRRVSHPATLAWLAGHELRLGWRDWVSLMTAGRRNRARTVAIALIVFAAFMHVFAYSIVARLCRRRRRIRHGDAGRRHRHAGAVVVAAAVAGDGVGDPRLLCALRSRSDPDLAGVGAQSVRGAHGPHRRLRRSRSPCCWRRPSSTCWRCSAARAGSPPMAWSPPWARWRRRRRSR